MAQDARPSCEAFLQLEPYTAPEWASKIPLLPAKRFRLGMLPTPLHEWRLPGLPEGVRLLIKRDDLSGMQMSGNKVRKLEFLLAEAVERGCDCVITAGGVQSNHARATAVAARYLGLEPHLILRTSRSRVDCDPGLVGNLMVERMAGAQLHLITKEEYAAVGSIGLLDQLKAQLEAAGRKPYVIPVGGSSALGVWGYLQAVDELVAQAERFGGITDIAMACGSGGTTAGLALGSFLSPLKARVHAYGVCDTPDYFYDFIDQLFRDMGLDPERLGGPTGDPSVTHGSQGGPPTCDSPVTHGSRALLRAVQARGAGYAISTKEELQTAQAVSAATGVVLDPVYSGKALHALLAEMAEAPREWRGRTVLFVHTGGLLGMYDKLDQLGPLVQAEGPPVRRMQVRLPPS